MKIIEKMRTDIRDFKAMRDHVNSSYSQPGNIGRLSDLREGIAETFLAKKILETRKEIDDEQMFNLMYAYRHIYKQVRALDEALAFRKKDDIKKLVKWFDDVDRELIENIYGYKIMEDK